VFHLSYDGQQNAAFRVGSGPEGCNRYRPLSDEVPQPGQLVEARGVANWSLAKAMPSPYN
jgi:hypothetical protein